ncbi:bifunctional hydroxymethylpyrimidine kinase/phosphomethylpyrimidine kinase [Acidithiobacillus montserratensis]|uniref:Bifunctional hydroxymethylpyrimidine kinase/phosphomethylpyrimidine kinase n=1 Tax=Acidithiobacillus montserratensis TaxID=2729135 RepID=A0ACD5HF25_9PROT|nr:bifunctional hydroxymethylpyrimidine kinase/phosphomethylpyrimidine kinase [Acidithiobacillus montserratensis]MBN2679497.1 bifunctional hydroxymethylpyrimidine kinase/phosphomethylpyrimidine kinase [Acidithiobacillaceae bacterium]MBU2747365.1 bifunctional hydroxymethylpyrimidine kinase/phosphomethylpyrimidine kinase [Acidithiobacillus montserratensis]
MHPPVVLSIGGSDPSAGAGIQADLLTLAGLGVHGCTAITALTVQDSVNVQGFSLVPPKQCLQQAQAIMDDIPVRVIKIGMLGSAEMVTALADWLAQYPDIPVVLDPVMAAGGGTSLALAGLREAVIHRLLPKITILTPNAPEALLLADVRDLESAGAWLNQQGAQWVLITGGHGDTPELENRLYHLELLQQIFYQQWLPQHYHGSGCTLASAIAAGLAKGMELQQAVQEALDFTHAALRQAYPLGRGQYFPRRFYQRETAQDAHEQG